MDDSVDDTTEPTTGKVVAAAPVAKPTKKSFGFLDEDGFRDLRSPLVGRFLKDHIERIEEEIIELKPYQKMYFEVKSQIDSDRANKKLTQFAVALSSIMLTAGGLGIGMAKDLWGTGPYGPIIAASSVMLVVGSFFIKVKDA
jgi:hypothetical protein